MFLSRLMKRVSRSRNLVRHIASNGSFPEYTTKDRISMLNYTMTVDEENFSATVHTDGLQFTDYDLRTLHPSPHLLLNFVQSSLLFSHFTPIDVSGKTLGDYGTAMGNYLPFIATSRTEFGKATYDPKIRKNPLDVKIHAGYIGNSSIEFIVSMYTKCGSKLSDNSAMVVNMDKTTRRAAPFPDWWKNKYATLSRRHKPIRLEQMTVPDNSMKYTIRVLGSDTDLYGHSNWTNYIRFAQDAIYHLTKRCHVEHFSISDITRLQKAEMVYGGESFEGDYLDVFVWVSEQEERAIWAQIYKESTFIFQGLFQYFSD